MNKDYLEVLKELAATRDCSIHWFSEYNIALDSAIKEIEKHRKCTLKEQETCDVEKRRLRWMLLRCE